MQVVNVKFFSYFSYYYRLLVYVLCINWKYLELPLWNPRLMGQGTSRSFGMNIAILLDV
jgi:hypothetical protein